MSKAATNHNSSQLDLFEIKAAVAVAVSAAFDREHQNTRRLADPKRDLTNYPANMTVQQVRSYLNCSFQHVMNLIDEGALPATNIAAPGSTQRCLRIKRDDLTTFITKQNL
jgi:excisionase family DNA binding protein